MSKGFGPDELLACYARGTFPMADGRDDPRLFLVDPDQRGVLPLDQVHVPRRLKRTVRTTAYIVTINQAFREVVELCAAPSGERTETWINQLILELYDGLHRRGHGFSVETWHEGHLVGGLYGVRLGAAFFGESMFSRARDASKIALVHLVAHLIAGGFRLLDTQFLTDHLTQFGTIEVNRKTYHALLADAITRPSTFPVPGLLVPEPRERDPSEAQTHLDLPQEQQEPMPLHLDPPRQLCLQSAGGLCLEMIEQHLAAQQPPHN
jgi:leucyl/phenylalanyl-tRNA--protein transferase